MSTPIIVGHKPTTHATNAAPHVYEAICAVTSELSKEGVGKERKNQKQGYQFRGVEDVQNALAPVLAAHKLCMLPNVIERSTHERQTKDGGVLFYVTLRVRFDLVSAQDGSSHSIVTEGEAMDSGDKATNKAMSAAFKYAATLAFCIPTEGAEDADYHSPEPAPKAAPASPPRAIEPAAVRQANDKEKLRDRVDRVISTVALLDSIERINKAFALSQELREELFLQDCQDMLKMLEDAFAAARERTDPVPF